MAWAKNGTPSTLTGTGSNVTISDLTAKTFNQILSHDIQASTYSAECHLNGATSGYAFRYSGNGGADATGTSATKFMGNYSAGAGGYFFNGYIINISSQEKLGIWHTCEVPTTGAGYAPNRLEWVSKWVNTSVQFTSIDFTKEVGTGDLQIGSNISAIESEGTPVAVNIQNGTVFEETDTNKSFIFNSSTGAWTQI